MGRWHLLVMGLFRLMLIADAIHRAVLATRIIHEKFMWGPEDAGRFVMYEFTGIALEEAYCKFRQLVGELEKNSEHDCYVWTRLYGRSSIYWSRSWSGS